MASRSVSDLTPGVARLALDLVALSRAAGIDLLIYCTLRTVEEQRDLYASGRTTPGKVLTHARPGFSKHNPDGAGKARAFDCVPMVNGRAAFLDVEKINKVGRLGESIGLVWGGNFGSVDAVHFEGK